jgi:3-methyladenine DNA glycosylase/8-oxoguanine DNA glycosylase
MRRSYWRWRKKATPLALELKLASRFGPHAGYAQQYLFHHARMTQRRARG